MARANPKVKVEKREDHLRDNGKQLIPNRVRIKNAIKDIINCIQIGENKQDILEMIQNHYGYTWTNAQHIWERANNELEEKYDKYQDKVVEKNIKRIETIITEAYDNGELKTALSAIDLLNKTCNLYDKKITVKTEEPIKISFD